MTDSQSLWPRDELSALVDRYERPLLAYASRMLNGDESEAQDAVQETFLRLCREDPNKIRSRVAAWLFSVCRSRVIDMLRTKKPMPVDQAVQAMPDTAPSAPDVASDAEEQSQLKAAVEDLTPKQQEVLRLRMQGGLSYREIAEVTGLTVTNVGFHLHAAVKSLHGRLATP